MAEALLERPIELRIWKALEGVSDPEIPVLTVVDLGIVREVRAGDPIEVLITPTYSGCPAMHTIEVEIGLALARAGFPDAKITTALAPPWTTDWLSDAGRQKLETYGIAPPAEASTSKRALFGGPATVRCPHCRSNETQRVSEFGSTACKALYRCKSCLEPFDYFKCI